MEHHIALYIENEEIRKILQIILEMQDFKIFPFQNPSEAESLMRKHPMDLFILQGRPDSEDVLLLRKIKEKGIPVLVIDAEEQGSIDRYLGDGADEFLIWPATLKQAVTRINNALKLKLNSQEIKKAVDTKAQELIEVQSVMIESLASLAEYRDTDTGGHIRRTQNYAKALAMELRKSPKYQAVLTDEEIELIYLSVPLHDIGKVGERDDILLKPGKLTEEEFEIMKQHTVIGYEAIRSAEKKLNNNAFLRYAAEVAYTHQEKWDGSGYPRGISGEEIPLIGRLMAVADVYDALVSERVYKEAVDHETAKRTIIDGSGAHFDPEIVEAFIAVEATFKNIASLYADVRSIKEKKRKEDAFNFKERIGSEVSAEGSCIKNILLVDDSKFMLTMFANQLTNSGYNVKAVLDAKSAYDIFLKNEIDLIITDLEMPEINGCEFVKMIRECPVENRRNVPVLALTASQYDLSVEDARKKGFTDYMLKPLDMELLKYKLGEYEAEA